MELTNEQKANFAKVNASFGLDPHEYTHTKEDVPSGNVVFSSDPIESDVKPHIVPVANIREMRKLLNPNDDINEETIEHPKEMHPEHLGLVKKALNKKELHASLTPELKDNLRKAAVAHVLGDPERVKSYEDTINALNFPGKVAVFASSDLNVPAGTTHTITGDSPVVLNYQKITVGAGAEIRVEVDANITSQIFVQQG